MTWTPKVHIMFLTKDTTCQILDPRAIFGDIKFYEIRVIQNNAPLCPYKSFYSFADDFRAYSVMMFENDVDMV